MVLAHDINKISRTEDIKIHENVSFSSMLLSQKTLEGLQKSGFYKPSPIQLHGIPLGKCGFDLLLEAKSGTGKTVVFSVIALEKLVLQNGLQVIILAPTREIASQICDVIKEIGINYTGLVVEVVMGGTPVQSDKTKFSKNKKVHIVVGSPGRLKHLIQDKHIDVSAVRLFVLDEADKLMEKSFQADINYIFSALPKQKQVIMSSATYPESSKPLVENYMLNSQHVCPSNSSVLLGVQQKVTVVQYNSNIVNQTSHRYNELLKIFSQIQFKQCLIFCNYQVRVTELYKMLTKDKWPAEQLYGQQEQTDRLDAIKTLREFKCRILISTDLAARGIDASNVDLVISFEPPFEWTTYLHRIGRAGRYGSHGSSITILSKGKEVTSFRNMLTVVMSDSDNIHDLWSNEIFSMSENADDNKGNNKHIISVTDGKQCELLHDIIGKKESQDDNQITVDSIVSSFENAGDVQTFDNLLKSFENHEVSESNITKGCCTVEINDTSVNDLLAHLNSNGKHETNVTNGESTVNVTHNLSSDINANSDTSTVSKGQHNFDKNKSNKTHKKGNIAKNKECQISSNVYYKRNDGHNNSDDIAIHNLPTTSNTCKSLKSVSFESQYEQKHESNKSLQISFSRKGLKNKTKPIQLKDSPSQCEQQHDLQATVKTKDLESSKNNTKPVHTKGSECQYDEESESEEDSSSEESTSESESVTDCDDYDQRNYSAKSKGHLETACANYFEWYKQLKNRTQQMEYMVYIQEMNRF